MHTVYKTATHVSNKFGHNMYTHACTDSHVHVHAHVHAHAYVDIHVHAYRLTCLSGSSIWSVYDPS